MFYKRNWKSLGIVLCLLYVAAVVLFSMLIGEGIGLADRQPPIVLSELNTIGMLIGLFTTEAGVVLSGIASVMARIKKTETAARYVLAALWCCLGAMLVLYLFLKAEMILAVL